MLFIKKNILFYLETSVIDNTGSFENTLSLTYRVEKSIDGSLVDSGSMTIEGDTYKASTTFTDNGQHRILYYTPSGYENGMEQINVFDQDFNTLTEVIDHLIKIEGLLHDFTVIDEQVWAGCNLLSARVRSFGNKSDADNGINPIHTWTITATYNTNGKLNYFKQVEI